MAVSCASGNKCLASTYMFSTRTWNHTPGMKITFNKGNTVYCVGHTIDRSDCGWLVSCASGNKCIVSTYMFSTRTWNHICAMHYDQKDINERYV